jgi:membrane-associated phospholipid phosphatase
MKKIFLIILLMPVLFFACTNNSKIQLPNAAEVLHQNENNLTDLIIYDIFSPPVASRIYAYTSLAAYEAMKYADTNAPSITSRLKGFGAMPQPNKNGKYDFTLAASKAFYTVAGQMTFSKDTLTKFEEQTYFPYKQALEKEVYDSSIAFGEAIAKTIMQRAAADNYKQTRPLEKFYGSKEDGKWRPTSPDYLDGVEPYWKQLKTFILDSANQFNPGPPPAFSTAGNSVFYKINKEVYDTGKVLTQEQKDIALFWDDNPFVMEHSGHLMAATKKQTPGGHWMGIATIACRQGKADAVKSARTYALTSLALFEAFISVFETKYRYVYIRPISAINSMIDTKWEPFLQTPPFPEYTSGHSTITGSAATVLTNLYGINFAFTDTSNMRYINMQRKYSSFLQASDECSISRFYGGIHYKVSVDTGAAVGKRIGKFIIGRVAGK